MIIVLKSETSDADVADVERRIRAMGYTPHTIRGELRNVIGAIGDDRGKERLRALESLECVESVTPILQPFKLASREVRRDDTQVRVGDVVVGGRTIVVMAGPCSVESRLQLLDVAAHECPPDASTAVYRVVQEALTNAVRHSDATRARILTSS